MSPVYLAADIDRYNQLMAFEHNPILALTCDKNNVAISFVSKNCIVSDPGAGSGLSILQIACVSASRHGVWHAKVAKLRRYTDVVHGVTLDPFG